MRIIIKVSSVFFLLVLTFQSIGQTEYQMEIQHHRDSIDAEFSNPEESILKEEDLKEFEGLPFYEIKEEYKIECEFEKIEDGEEFEMKTSTERLPVYRPYGILTFTINGVEEKLTVYQNVKLSQMEEYKDYLFIPFTDLSNGEETYGGGRYLDISVKDLDSPVLDFNLCYNPYCAYNDRFSCPVPPSENHLDTKIEAGVKKWH